MHSGRSKLPTSSSGIRPQSEKRPFGSVPRTYINTDDTGALNPNAQNFRNRQSIVSANRLSNSAFKPPSSGIKSALKNQLYTPQNPRSSAFSSSHSSSKKGTFSGGERRPLADERPLCERSFHEQCVSRLVQFFGADTPEAKVVRQFSISMPTKDVESIFKILLEFLGFTITAVPFESEVQKIMKDLGYPYQINKSSLQSISTAKGRGSVLGMLDWLVSCVSYHQNVNVDKILFAQPDDPEQMVVSKELLRLVLLNDTENDTNQLEQIALQKYGSADQLEQLNEELRSLEQELKVLQQQVNRERTVPIAVKELQSAVEQLERYIFGMRQYLNTNQQTLEELQRTNKQQDAELDGLKNELAGVQNQVRSQKVRIEDVDRSNQHIRQFQTEINVVESSVTQALNERDDLQLRISQRRLELQRRCAEVCDWYNQMLIKLNTPSMKKWAGSMRSFIFNESTKLLIEKFENPNFQSGFEELLGEFEQFAKAIRHNCIDVHSELQCQMGSSKRRLTDLDVRLKELSEKVERLSKTQHELESKLEMTKQSQREERNKILEEIEQTEKKISKMIADIRTMNEKKEKLLQDEALKVKEEYEEAIKQMREKMDSICEMEQTIAATVAKLDEIYKNEKLLLPKKRERFVQMKAQFIKNIENKIKVLS